MLCFLLLSNSHHPFLDTSLHFLSTSMLCTCDICVMYIHIVTYKYAYIFFPMREKLIFVCLHLPYNNLQFYTFFCKQHNFVHFYGQIQLCYAHIRHIFFISSLHGQLGWLHSFTTVSSTIKRITIHQSV